MRESIIKFYHNFMGYITNKPYVILSKDPKDYTLDKLSTPWKVDSQFCKFCRKSTSHSEYMSDICNGCGSFNTQSSNGRSYRKIYIDGEWKYQVRYKNGNEEIRKEWY